MNKTNVISLCSGYDAMVLALKHLRRDFPDKFDFDLLAWSEIDPYACAAHDALHPEFAERAVGDMTAVDWAEWSVEHGNPTIHCLVYSTPCQSVSTAGKQRGMKKGDDAASSLIWHTEKAIAALRPKWLLLENVKGMVNKRNKADFDRWCGVLESYGYTNYWTVLNAKDYGVPQNRERVFMVSVLGSSGFVWPKAFPLEKRLRDILEKDVGAGYYLKPYQVERALGDMPKQACMKFEETYDIVSLTPIKEPKVLCVASVRPERSWQGSVKNQDRIYDPGGIAPTLHCCGGGNLQPKILQIGSSSPSAPCNAKVLAVDGIRPTLLDDKGAEPAIIEPFSRAIRKLTPRECFRLMGVDDVDIDKIEAYRRRRTLADGTAKEKPISKSQKYKMAGNSIVVDVLYHIFSQMFIAPLPKPRPIQMSLFEE